MANALIQNPVDRENHIVHGVKVLGFTSANGRIYDFAAVKEAIAKYEKAPVNKDHNMEEPSFSDRLGWLENVTLEKDGLYADFHYNPHADGIESFLWFAEHNGLGDVGFSHLVSGKYSVDPDGTERITRIDKVKSVDLVANPATTKTIFESEVKPMEKKVIEEATQDFGTGDSVQYRGGFGTIKNIKKFDKGTIYSIRNSRGSEDTLKIYDDEAKNTHADWILKVKKIPNRKEKSPGDQGYDQRSAYNESEKLDQGNNETLSKGIEKNKDGTYTALTYSASKTFKTLAGAKKWMNERPKPMKEAISSGEIDRLKNEFSKVSNQSIDDDQLSRLRELFSQLDQGSLIKIFKAKMGVNGIVSRLALNHIKGGLDSVRNSKESMEEQEDKPMGKKIAKEAGNAANKAKKNELDRKQGEEYMRKNADKFKPTPGFPNQLPADYDYKPAQKSFGRNVSKSTSKEQEGDSEMDNKKMMEEENPMQEEGMQEPMMEEADDVYAKIKEICEGEGSDEEKSKQVLEMLGLSGGMSEGEGEPMEEAEEDPKEKDGSESAVLEVDDEEEEEPKKESKSELASLRKWKAEKLKEEKIVNLIKESNLEPTKVFIKQLSAIDSKLWSEAINDRKKVALVKSSVKPISSGLQSRSESSYKQFLESVLGK